MKRISILFLVFTLNFTSFVNAQELNLEDYLLKYDYESRIEMKIQSKELIELLKENKAQLIDIRFEEEYKSWNIPIAISIPLADLPNNLDKIDKSKIIVTACPQKTEQL